MAGDERRLRGLIERWARAVGGCVLEGVVADRTEDVVMFDVPPPHEGVRGIEGYRTTWPPFFEWLRGGACFGLVSLEVTAGGDMAFAQAPSRLRHAGGSAQGPGAPPPAHVRAAQRGGRRAVAHEHRSFPLKDRAAGRTGGDEQG